MGKDKKDSIIIKGDIGKTIVKWNQEIEESHLYLDLLGINKFPPISETGDKYTLLERIKLLSNNKRLDFCKANEEKFFSQDEINTFEQCLAYGHQLTEGFMMRILRRNDVF